MTKHLKHQYCQSNCPAYRPPKQAEAVSITELGRILGKFRRGTWTEEYTLQAINKLISEEVVKELESLPRETLHSLGLSYGDYTEVIPSGSVEERIRKLRASKPLSPITKKKESTK